MLLIILLNLPFNLYFIYLELRLPNCTVNNFYNLWQNNSENSEPSSSDSSSESLYPSDRFSRRKEVKHSNITRVNLRLCKNNSYCQFCKNNGKSPTEYKSHELKDENGRVVCPVLKIYTCPICGETGSKAHTIKYCKRFVQIINRSNNMN